MVLRPKVVAVVVCLQIARAVHRSGGGQLLPPRVVPLVGAGGLRRAVWREGEQPLERLIAQLLVLRESRVAFPEGSFGHRVAADEHKALPAHARLEALAHEAAAVAPLAEEDDHAALRPREREELQSEVARVLEERLRRLDVEAGDERVLNECLGDPRAVGVGRVGEGDARVPPQLLQHVGEHRRREGVGRDDAEEVGVRLAVAQRVAGGGGREDGHAREAGDLRRGDRRARAAGADDRGDALASEGLAREVERAGEARGVVALGVAVGEEQLRVGEQLVGDAVALVVDLAQRLVDRRNQRGARQQHRQQHPDAKHRHARRRGLRRLAVVRGRVG
mmetsp:Transcript_12988/g.32405  ORF Transcript_12988/g.32405 Transcript_12988/m.32405 type:complete len:335 (-) Transcript_12988:1168-2172(-)